MDENTVLEEIRPLGLTRVIDAAEAAGVDVSAWIASGNPSNPKYCYEWAFSGRDDRPVMLFLWHEDCEIDDDGVFQKGSVRKLIHELEAKRSPSAGRARRFDDALQRAWNKNRDVRVAIVDSRDRTKALIDGDTMRASARELDPLPWRLVSYDFMSGEYLIRRPISDRALFGGGQGAALAGEIISSSTKINDYTSELTLAADLHEIFEDRDLSATVRDALVEARVGQGDFRAALISRWGASCAVSGLACLSVLRASHVKPWRESTSRERLDPNNGLLLSANLDALFDAHLISFHGDGSMWVSGHLPKCLHFELSIPAPIRMPLTLRERHYLSIHLEESCAIESSRR